MRINDIEPKFKEHEKALEKQDSVIRALSEQVEALTEQLQAHEEATISHAHTGQPAAPEAELTGDEVVSKVAADAAESPLQEAVDAIQEVETPTEVVKEMVETVEEVTGKVATEVEDATFPLPDPEPEPEPEEVESVATVEVVVSGNVDPRVMALVQSLESVRTDSVKVTVDKRE